MKRITVSLPDTMAGALEREAHRRRVSLSEVVRESLAARMQVPGSEGRALPFAALGNSGHRSTARDFEEALALEWARDRGR